MKFGSAKYDNKKSNNTHRIKEGDNKFRPLPPMLSLAEEGRWSLYAGTHYGYSGIDRTDPSKTKQRPFRCIQEKNFRNNMVTQECGACDVYDAEKVRIEQAEEELTVSLRKEGKTDEEIEEIVQTSLGADKAWLKAHNVDRKHHINAMSEDGKEFFQVAISHRTKKQMDEAFTRLREEEEIDPLDINEGVIVNIRRTGRKLAVVDTVEFVTEKIAGGGRKIVIRPLTEEEQDRALAECRDLTTCGGTVLTAEQIQALTETNGDPKAVDAVFSGARREVSPKPRPQPATPPPAAAKPATTTLKHGNPPADPIAAAAVDVKKNEIERRLALLKAKQEEVAKAAADKAREEEEQKAKAEAAARVQREASAKVEVAEIDIANLSDEDFLKLYGGETAAAAPEGASEA